MNKLAKAISNEMNKQAKEISIEGRKYAVKAEDRLGRIHYYFTKTEEEGRELLSKLKEFQKYLNPSQQEEARDFWNKEVNTIDYVVEIVKRGDDFLKQPLYPLSKDVELINWGSEKLYVL